MAKNEMSSTTSLTFEQLVFRALDRINSLSGGENTSYNPMAHESCINSLWYMIPLKSKKQAYMDGLSFGDAWDALSDKPRADSVDLRQRDAEKRICEKQQLLTELLDSLELLFDAPDSDVGLLSERGYD